MNAEVINNWHDQIELNISHQSSQGGDYSSSTRESGGLRDEQATNDDNSNEAHVATKGESFES